MNRRSLFQITAALVAAIITPNAAKALPARRPHYLCPCGADLTRFVVNSGAGLTCDGTSMRLAKGAPSLHAVCANGCVEHATGGYVRRYVNEARLRAVAAEVLPAFPAFFGVRVETDREGDLCIVARRGFRSVAIFVARERLERATQAELVAGVREFVRATSPRLAAP